MIGAAGPRNKKITIQRLREDPQPDGDANGAPETVATALASIEPLAGQERMFAQQQQATTTHKLGMVYIAGIKPNMRAVWNGRVFNFDSVINVKEENRELLIMATEVVT